MGLGLDMAPCPQPDSRLVGSPLGLICLSLLLIPAAGASSCPHTLTPARAAPRPHPAGPGAPCPGGHRGWVALGVPG